MSTSERITISAFVNRPVDIVWTSWTDPVHITKWNAASDDWHCPTATNDLRTGGSFSATMAARDGSFSFDFGGVYDEVELHKRIAYTMDDGCCVSVVFIAERDGVVIIEQFESEFLYSYEL